MIASRSAFSPDHRDYSSMFPGTGYQIISAVYRDSYAWEGSIRFTSPFYRRTILSPALCRFAFSCRECCCYQLLRARVCVGSKKRLLHVAEIRVDAEMRSIDAKCSHFSQSFLPVSRYYEPASFLSRRVSAPTTNVIQPMTK